MAMPTEPVVTIIDPASFEPQIDIEIFLRVKGRLPTKKGNKLTVKICRKFIKEFAGHPKHGRWVGHAFRRLLDLQGAE